MALIEHQLVTREVPLLEGCFISGAHAPLWREEKQYANWAVIVGEVALPRARKSQRDGWPRNALCYLRKKRRPGGGYYFEPDAKWHQEIDAIEVGQIIRFTQGERVRGRLCNVHCYTALILEISADRLTLLGEWAGGGPCPLRMLAYLRDNPIIPLPSPEDCTPGGGSLHNFYLPQEV